DINGAKAEVFEHYGKREIQINISGKNRKDAMAIVMYEIDKIHSTYSKLKYSKQIPCNCDVCKKANTPHYYPYDVLLKFYNNAQEGIQCQESFLMVDVIDLLSDSDSNVLPKFSKDKQTQGKRVEINIGDNSKVGNIVLDSKIEDSFKLITDSDIDVELRETLLQLYDAVDILIASLIEEEAKEDVTRDLNVLIEEAVKVAPRRKWYELSAEGLIKAAETVGKVGKPVIELAGKIVAILLSTKGI
ncbi:MAG TPA: hypothetical protein PKX08_19070, partial [Cyclobacteriaceae bacterium]|nr:hypothetical protein [Cyclobacteriaceae bacterium]